MTENEAKEYIRSRICNEKGIQKFCRDNCMYGEGQCAFQIAIKALEEIQQYRAIGTVERLKHLEEYVDTINKLCADYSAIGTVEELQALKEKNDKDFELLLKAVKESYPMFKGAYVEFDVFMGDVMRRFTRERK